MIRRETARLFSALLLLAVAQMAAAAVPLVIPGECITTDGEVVCGRLNSGASARMEKFGMCVTLTNGTDEDFFVPMKSVEEIEAFLGRTESLSINVEVCPFPGH